MTDIANECGVSVSTISRALSDPTRVSVEMRQRVMAKANELGYFKGDASNSDARVDRGHLALVVQNMTNPYVFELIRGCQNQAQSTGHMLSVMNAQESVQLETDLLRSLPEAVDGIILAAPRSADTVIQMTASRVPVVLVNREVTGVQSVAADTAGGITSAVEHLVSLGHRRIWYVGGPTTSWSDRQRYSALVAESRARDVVCERVGSFVPTADAAIAAAERLMGLEAPVAVLFFNDVLAIGAMQHFAKRGVRVPDDISVIGWDNIMAADWSSPPLTTLASGGEAIGRVAADSLISRLTATPVVRAVNRMPVHLKVRNSTGPAGRAGGGVDESTDGVLLRATKGQG